MCVRLSQVRNGFVDFLTLNQKTYIYIYIYIYTRELRQPTRVGFILFLLLTISLKSPNGKSFGGDLQCSTHEEMAVKCPMFV